MKIKSLINQILIIVFGLALPLFSSFVFSQEDGDYFERQEEQFNNHKKIATDVVMNYTDSKSCPFYREYSESTKNLTQDMKSVMDFQQDVDQADLAICLAMGSEEREQYEKEQVAGLDSEYKRKSDELYKVFVKGQGLFSPLSEHHFQIMRPDVVTKKEQSNLADGVIKEEIITELTKTNASINLQAVFDHFGEAIYHQSNQLKNNTLIEVVENESKVEGYKVYQNSSHRGQPVDVPINAPLCSFHNDYSFDPVIVTEKNQDYRNYIVENYCGVFEKDGVTTNGEASMSTGSANTHLHECIRFIANQIKKTLNLVCELRIVEYEYKVERSTRKYVEKNQDAKIDQVSSASEKLASNALVGTGVPSKDYVESEKRDDARYIDQMAKGIDVVNYANEKKEDTVVSPIDRARDLLEKINKHGNSIVMHNPNMDSSKRGRACDYFDEKIRGTELQEYYNRVNENKQINTCEEWIKKCGQQNKNIVLNSMRFVTNLLEATSSVASTALPVLGSSAFKFGSSALDKVRGIVQSSIVDGKEASSSDRMEMAKYFTEAYYGNYHEYIGIGSYDKGPSFDEALMCFVHHSFKLQANSCRLNCDDGDKDCRRYYNFYRRDYEDEIIVRGTTDKKLPEVERIRNYFLSLEEDRKQYAKEEEEVPGSWNEARPRRKGQVKTIDHINEILTRTHPIYDTETGKIKKVSFVEAVITARLQMKYLKDEYSLVAFAGGANLSIFEEVEGGENAKLNDTFNLKTDTAYYTNHYHEIMGVDEENAAEEIASRVTKDKKSIKRVGEASNKLTQQIKTKQRIGSLRTLLFESPKTLLRDHNNDGQLAAVGNKPSMLGRLGIFKGMWNNSKWDFNFKKVKSSKSGNAEDCSQMQLQTKMSEVLSKNDKSVSSSLNNDDEVENCLDGLEDQNNKEARASLAVLGFEMKDFEDGKINEEMILQAVEKKIGKKSGSKLVELGIIGPEDIDKDNDEMRFAIQRVYFEYLQYKYNDSEELEKPTQDIQSSNGFQDKISIQREVEDGFKLFDIDRIQKLVSVVDRNNFHDDSNNCSQRLFIIRWIDATTKEELSKCTQAEEIRTLKLGMGSLIAGYQRYLNIISRFQKDKSYYSDPVDINEDYNTDRVTIDKYHYDQLAEKIDNEIESIGYDLKGEELANQADDYFQVGKLYEAASGLFFTRIYNYIAEQHEQRMRRKSTGAKNFKRWWAENRIGIALCTVGRHFFFAKEDFSNSTIGGLPIIPTDEYRKNYFEYEKICGDYRCVIPFPKHPSNFTDHNLPSWENFEENQCSIMAMSKLTVEDFGRGSSEESYIKKIFRDRYNSHEGKLCVGEEYEEVEARFSTTRI
ncbi:hypothetical protein N9N67_08085 [Bacteriovoracaceae bacterium]|nr:hypothetical protein [Bacteriovoracaceae bacterium]